MSTKAQRQQALVRIIETKEVSSQNELRTMLAKEGITATFDRQPALDIVNP